MEPRNVVFRLLAAPLETTALPSLCTWSMSFVARARL